MGGKFDFRTFLDAHGQTFAEYLSHASTAARTDKRHGELNQQVEALYEKYPKVAAVIDMNDAHELTLEECRALIAVLSKRNEVVGLEMEHVYFKGCGDCVGYLREMKIL